MNVGSSTVVTLEYVLEVEGEEIEATQEGEPVSFLYGHGHLLPRGLEVAVHSLPSGAFEKSLRPEEGYGPYDPERVSTADRGDFPPDAGLEPGSEFYAQEASGSPVAVRVTSVEGDRVTVDANPRLAGKTLEYRGVIHRVREATPEELDHGHAHGEGGCHH
ncbi:MAG: peptidylprolyl isomerase [Rubrobacter sp.]|nr:peptidylprolyl isomerase [Rubrobacter sp.]